jgi:cell division transport system permease protein
VIQEIIGVLRRSWQAHFWTNLATTCVLTLSFSLICGTLLLSTNITRLFAVWGNEVQVSVYLKDSITAPEKQSLEEALKHNSTIESFSFTDKDTAEKSFERSLSSYGSSFLNSLKNVGDNPFPASYVIKIKKEDKTPEFIQELAKNLGNFGGVEDVSYGQEWLKNYSALTKVFQSAVMIFTFVLLLACLFTVSNSVRASLTSRRDEIEILELVGATPTHIRRPFLIEGAFQGSVASGLAVLMLGVFYSVIHQTIEKVMGASEVASSMQFLSPVSLFFILTGGLFFGALGSYICVARMNTGWAANAESLS